MSASSSVGAVPALLTLFIRLFGPESGKWVKEKGSGAASHWSGADQRAVLGCDRAREGESCRQTARGEPDPERRAEDPVGGVVHHSAHAQLDRRQPHADRDPVRRDRERLDLEHAVHGLGHGVESAGALRRRDDGRVDPEAVLLRVPFPPAQLRRGFLRRLGHPRVLTRHDEPCHDGEEEQDERPAEDDAGAAVHGGVMQTEKPGLGLPPSVTRLQSVLSNSRSSLTKLCHVTRPSSLRTVLKPHG